MSIAPRYETKLIATGLSADVPLPSAHAATSIMDQWDTIWAIQFHHIPTNKTWRLLRCLACGVEEYSPCYLTTDDRLALSNELGAYKMANMPNRMEWHLDAVLFGGYSVTECF